MSNQKETQTISIEQIIADWLKLIAVGNTDAANAIIENVNQESLSRKCVSCGGHIHHVVGCSMAK